VARKKGATTVILSSGGMENPEGNWPVPIEPSPVTGIDFDLVMQEDQELDTEVKTGKKKEEIAYIVLEQARFRPGFRRKSLRAGLPLRSGRG
jgi:hypothetical protein